jgi:hypothetical protein
VSHALKLVSVIGMISFTLHGCQPEGSGDGGRRKAEAPSPGLTDSGKAQGEATASFEAIVKNLRQDFPSSEVRTLASIPDLGAQKTTIKKELMDQFCVHSYKLPLKDNFDTELGYFCDASKKPTVLFANIDRYSKIVKDFPVAAEIESGVEGAYSKSVVVAIYEVPIPPKFVKEGHIPEFMTALAKFPYFKQEGKIQKDLNSDFGGDLQFSKYELYYGTENKTKDGKTFSNERVTQFNAYQVHGGNADIGLGAEHMLGSNAKYKYFKTLTITIGTESGGAAVITLANLNVVNNGYPEDARKMAIDTATAQAAHVREGVLKEKADRILK